uniref:Uncharacterized protein LOC114348391 n=1 Tax=Diabrotica virgifera virgifera TaxID=50390 RepID=A0A6P7GYE8_DIAVI
NKENIQLATQQIIYKEVCEYNILVPNRNIDSDIESDNEEYIMLPSAPLAYPVIEGVDDDELENSSKFTILSNILLENEEILENEANNEKVENAEVAKNNELDERIAYVVDETLADELDHKPLNLKKNKQQQK